MNTPLDYQGDADELLNRPDPREHIQKMQRDIKAARADIQRSFIPPRPKHNYTALEQLAQIIWAAIGNQQTKNNKLRILKLDNLPVSMSSPVLRDMHKRLQLAKQL